MGMKSEEVLEIGYDEFPTYLHANHSVYMQYGEDLYYLTDANDIYWRAQDTTKFNEKDHYVDCSELVPVLSEFLRLPFLAYGKCIEDVFEDATFYASYKPEA